MTGERLILRAQRRNIDLAQHHVSVERDALAVRRLALLAELIKIETIEAAEADQLPELTLPAGISVDFLLGWTHAWLNNVAGQLEGNDFTIADYYGDLAGLENGHGPAPRA